MSTAKKLLPFWVMAMMLIEAPAPAEEFRKPIVIAHRGASGYRPEHTLAAYELAINLGADFVEPDLVPTKDGQMVARHENQISGTTDVADHPEFADRQKTKNVDGKPIKGWFTEDFTLAEIKTLRAKERLPQIRQRNTIYNGHYEIPTFQEIIDLVRKKEAEQHRTIGIYPEVKHPTYFSGIGMSIEKSLLETLNRNNYVDKTSPVFIQCFEIDTLKKLHEQTSIKLIQLIDTEEEPYDCVANNEKYTIADMVKPDGLATIAKYAQGIGPSKDLILPRDAKGKMMKPTSLISDAHKVGLLVHPYTFRNENSFLPLDYRKNLSEPNSDALYGDAFAEYKLFYELGVDGVFSESPDTALAARALHRNSDP